MTLLNHSLICISGRPKTLTHCRNPPGRPQHVSAGRRLGFNVDKAAIRLRVSSGGRRCLALTMRLWKSLGKKQCRNCGKLVTGGWSLRSPVASGPKRFASGMEKVQTPCGCFCGYCGKRVLGPLLNVLSLVVSRKCAKVCGFLNHGSISWSLTD